MRNLTALLLLLLLSLCSLHLVFGGPVSFEYKTGCCSSTTIVKIPLKNIVSYWRTSDSDCPIKAIVFETLNKKQNIERKVCVNPEARWVKPHMRSVDLKNKATSTAKL